jgi:hypothetical protein
MRNNVICYGLRILVICLVTEGLCDVSEHGVS